MSKHESGTSYPSVGAPPAWGVDRARVHSSLDNLQELAKEARNEISRQGRTLVSLETRLDERTSNIRDLRSDLQEFDRELDAVENRLDEKIRQVRHAHANTVATQGSLVKDIAEMKKERSHAQKSSAIAMGSGGAVGGGLVYAIVEIVKTILGG